MTYCSVNGQLADASVAQISVQDRGFRYGDGVFETIAIVRGVPYQFAWHISRLVRGLESIKIVCDTASLQGYCRELLYKNKVIDGFLRIQVTRGVGSKGYLPDAVRPTIAIETLPASAINHEPVSLWHSSYCKVSPRALPVQFKLCQGLNSTLARMEAQEQGCFDALLLNEKGHVCETSSASIFWRKDNVVYTPSLASGALEGSTRAALLRMSHVTEVEATLEQLLEADAVCIANVSWKAKAVYALLPQSTQWQSESFAAHYSQFLDEDRKHDCLLHLNDWK